MSVKWTQEQQQVIKLRNRNLLVSAAAGSGKTAVLVERIIGRITDPEHPMDVDRLLVVTFTKAAAAEMRERIGKAIEERREADPENENLIRQSSLIHNAQICTIDSFCVFVVRNHFGEIGLDPNFRVADTGEIELLEQDTLEDLFEQQFQMAREEETSAFLQLVDSYSGKRNADAVKEMVLRIYRMSQSCPWPEKWIGHLPDAYLVKDPVQLQQSPVIRECVEELRRQICEYREKLARYRELASEGEGVAPYLPTLESDLAAFEQAAELVDYDDLIGWLGSFRFKSLPTIRKKAGINMEAKEIIHSGRNEMKKNLEKLAKDHGGADPESLLQQLERIAPHVCELSRLTLLYIDAMAKAKKKRHIADFSDIEHFALQILVDEESGRPTRTAEAFRHHYDEIMIDEYQDSNQVQEEILTAVSRIPEGDSNMFMVGDVKQSIYRFRQARPELFMEKYSSYTTEESSSQKIELHKNFRSRSQVLDFTNDMFYKLMAMDLGNVAYDDAAALYPGASYPEARGMDAEIILLDRKSLEEEAAAEAEEDDKMTLEARMVASRIKTLMEEGQVTDKASGKLRPMRYSDIVILFRSLKGWGSSFAEVLESQGIPAHVESSTGYFSAYEVQCLLNYLRILDNPYQDIPMAAVLRSPLAGLDEEELAAFRVEKPEGIYAAAIVEEMQACRKDQERESVLSAFTASYDHFRRMSQELPIHELILHILEESGFGNYVSCLPAGEHRYANLRMLVEKAIAYEKTSYKGLFHFVRYIDKMEKYDVDYGEADVTGENADVVHIMTIHKSKGLEFPVVFVSGLFKQFNRMDIRETMVLHPDLGLGIWEAKPTPRLRRPCLFHSQIADRIDRENLGEELRVLYVALTRAKEKLILTGLVKNIEKLYEKTSGNVIPRQALPYSVRRNAGCYGDWITAAAFSYPEKYHLILAEAEDLVWEQASLAAEAGIGREELLEQIRSIPESRTAPFEEAFAYRYAYAADRSRKAKYSVSELKHASMAAKYDEMEGEAEIPDFLLKEHESYIPSFAPKAPAELEEAGKSAQEARSESATEQGVSMGALRGTAVHRIMECMDFEAFAAMLPADERAIRAFASREISRMLQKGEITEEMQQLVPASMIAAFLGSESARQMARAAADGRLYREKPFVMKWEEVLVQGIIDVFWLQTNDAGEDELYLLDYKTDRIQAGQELIDRYQTQIDLYRSALERNFSNEERTIPVRDAILYSFSLQEEVHL